MILLTLLITVLLEYYFDLGARLRQYQWFDQFSHWVENQLHRYFQHTNDIAVLLAILFPIVLLVGLLQSLFNTPLYGLLDLIFGVLVLLATVEAKSLITAYMATSSNKSGAVSAALSDNPGHLTFAQFLRAEKQKVLCPVFWYVILGPMGAVLYRLSLVSCDNNQNSSRQSLLNTWVSWLEWLPVRMTVLSFAVVDSFVPCFKYWLTTITHPASANDDVLIDGASRASGIKAQAAVADKPESVGLIAHSMIFWLVLVAILTVTAWLN